MATGANLQPGRGREVSNLTPQVDLRTNDAQMWQQAERVFDMFADAAKPDLIRRAQARGSAEGAAIAAGEQEYRAPGFVFGDVAAAREQALQTAFNARTRTDIDARFDELRREHRWDPEAFQTASREVVSGFIQGAPSEFAVDIETYAQGKAAAGLSWVADQRAVRDEQEVVQSLAVREAALTERMIALAADGKIGSDEYREALAERSDLQDQRANNPAILYSEDQRVADDDKLDRAVLGASIGRAAVQTYQEQGRGLPGMAASMRFLEAEVLNGEAFAHLPPEQKRAIYRDAQNQLRDFYNVDREEQRAQDQQEREAREAQRELVGDYRLRLLMGEVTEAEIMADAKLDDTAKAGLVTARRAQERRAEADARRDAALERAEAREGYNTLRDSAYAGMLGQGEIADALDAGLISRGQAQTLRDMNDKQLKPLIDDIMAPFNDALRRPGMTQRGTAALRARAEQAATQVAREHPEFTLDERLRAGEAIATRLMGANGRGRPQNGQTAQSGQAQQLQALAAERTRRQESGRAMSRAEYDRRRNEIIHGS